MEEFKKGEWYIYDTSGAHYVVIYREKELGEGSDNGVWKNKIRIAEKDTNWREASKEEVKKMLLKEAAKRGFKEGCTFKNTEGGTAVLGNEIYVPNDCEVMWGRMPSHDGYIWTKQDGWGVVIEKAPQDRGHTREDFKVILNSVKFSERFPEFYVNVRTIAEASRYRELCKSYQVPYNPGWSLAPGFYGVRFGHPRYLKSVGVGPIAANVFSIKEFRELLESNYTNINNKNKSNEVQSENKQVRKGPIKGTAAVSNRRQSTTTGSRPRGNVTSYNRQKTGIRAVKIRSNVVQRRHS